MRHSPTHAFLPSVTRFCRNFREFDHATKGFTLPATARRLAMHAGGALSDRTIFSENVFDSIG
jgi:hypothetical protein